MKRIFRSMQGLQRIGQLMSRVSTADAVRISDGTLEGLKWLALASMTYDHVTRFLFSDTGVSPATAFGRLAFPLFAFIIAYNLSRAGSGPAVYERVLRRLLMFGVLAVPAMFYFFGPGQANILFTFAVSLLILWLIELRRYRWAIPMALLVFLVGGDWVEYAWYGLAFILACFAWVRLGATPATLALLALGFALLNYTNGSAWALLVLPIIYAAQYVKLDLPRSKWLFYYFYPAHLTLIAVIHWWWSR